MVNQNKIFSLEIKGQAKNIFPNDVERTVDGILVLENQGHSDFWYKTSL